MVSVIYRCWGVSKPDHDCGFSDAIVSLTLSLVLVLVMDCDFHMGIPLPCVVLTTFA